VVLDLVAHARYVLADAELQDPTVLAERLGSAVFVDGIEADVAFARIAQALDQVVRTRVAGRAI
jgi:hypothetical protein